VALNHNILAGDVQIVVPLHDVQIMFEKLWLTEEVVGNVDRLDFQGYEMRGPVVDREDQGGVLDVDGEFQKVYAGGV